eukprot:3196538-Lingulodinium_polyedra.AAC.1
MPWCRKCGISRRRALCTAQAPGAGHDEAGGLWEDHFLRLGGYEEGLLPMGCQDIDLLQRVKLAGGG